jgi:hypothetical protein
MDIVAERSRDVSLLSIDRDCIEKMTVTGNTEATEKQRFGLKIGPWLLRLAVALIFVSSGMEKFGIGPGQEWIRIFAKIGLGDWFRYLTGALEIAGGLLLVIPRATKVGVWLLVTCMTGAIVCHLFVLGGSVLRHHQCGPNRRDSCGRSTVQTRR